MANYQELITRLRSLIGEDADEDDIYRQASDAIEDLLANKEEPSPPEELTDHEAEGAMLYVMARGRL